MPKQKTHEEYIAEAHIKNPNIEVVGVYSGAHIKILHRCRIDGYEWYVTPNNILKGRSCPKCSAHIKRTHEQYVEEVKLINPNIEVLEEYITNMTPILHRCKIHNIDWKATPVNILKGHGCRKCGNEILANDRKKSKEQYIEDLKKVNSNIIFVGEYINAHIPTLHKCLIHEFEWEANPNNILSGKGCPICKESVGERQVRQWLCNNNIVYEVQYKFEDCCDINALPFDFYLPDYNACIEYDGEQHYRPIDYFGGQESFERTVKHDKLKNDYCANNNIRLLRISYLENIEEKLNNFLFI